MVSYSLPYVRSNITKKEHQGNEFFSGFALREVFFDFEKGS
jgi:hypothetical protein